MTIDYQEKITEIIKWVKNNYVNENKLLVQHSKNGSVSPILNDLGDYTPFLRYLREDEFCEIQFKELLNYLKSDLLAPSNRFARIGYVTPYEHSDLILGLLDDYAATKDPQKLQIAEQITQTVLKKFNTTNLKSSFYFPSLKIRLPLFDSTDGMYVELLVLLYKYTQKKHYLDLAEQIARRLIELPFFQKHGLFPSLHSRIPWLFPKSIKKRFSEIKLMKHNTNTLFGFLELYKTKPTNEIKQAIDYWIKSVQEKLKSPEGGICGAAYLKRNDLKKAPIELTPNFAVLEVVCDAYHFLKEPDYLKFAKEIGDYWLREQSETTGLLPLYPDKKFKESYFDSETDMLIALHKLAEISGDKKYKIAADRIMEGIIKYHRLPGGYCLMVNTETGEVTDKFFKVKFITLFLKALILYDQNKTIYNNPVLFDLLKDR